MSDDATMKGAQKSLEEVRKAKKAEVLNATPSLCSHLLAFLEMQSELPVIPKTRDGFKFKYAPYEQIAKLAFPVMWKHGFTITHKSSVFETHGEVVTTLTHVYSGREWVSSCAYNLVVTNQERGKSLTYGKRYNTALLLGLSIEGEPDMDDPPAQTNAAAKKTNNDIEF